MVAAESAAKITRSKTRNLHDIHGDNDAKYDHSLELPLLTIDFASRGHRSKFLLPTFLLP